MNEAPDGPAIRSRSRAFLPGLGAAAGIAFLLVLLRTHYLIFHAVAEMTSVGVSWAVFAVTWNAREVMEDPAPAVLGVAFLVVGWIDLVHTLAYEGMGVFPRGGVSEAAEFWLAARAIQAAAVLAAPSVRAPARPRWPLPVFGLAGALLTLSVFLGLFPTAFRPGTGLTPFKQAAEGVLTLAFLAAAVRFLRERERFGSDVAALLAGSAACQAASETAFALYAGPTDVANAAGHFLKIGACYLTYRAIVVTGVARPRALLFRRLREREAALRRSHRALEERVVRRTLALRRTNERLAKELAERKATAASLRRSEAAYRELVQHARTLIVRLSPEGRVVFLNEYAETFLGVRAEAVAGRPVETVLGRRGTEADGAAARALRTDADATVETRIRRPDGGTAWVQWTVRTREDADGRPAGRLLVGIDVTERKRAETLLAERNLELERTVRELDQFAHVVAHDLREPLRGVHNLAGFLMADLGERIDGESREMLETLSRLSRRMDEQVRAIRRFARIGREALDIVPADLNRALAAVRESLRVLADERGGEIAAPRPLPSVPCDPVLVQDLFRNLIANGLKYNDAVAPRVEIDAAGPERRPVFRVRDNGIGIPPERQEEVFAMFRRLHGRSEYSGGTGAGLAIARRIVRRHGGWIWLESAPGEGTTFFFTLEAHGDTDESDPAADPAR